MSCASFSVRTIKPWTNTVMNRSGAPANCWLLCLIYMSYLLNHIACSALDGNIPLLALNGIIPDISIILLFTFYQPVFYATYDQHFPSESQEMVGYWVGFEEHCGDAMTHIILEHDTQKIFYRSAVRPKTSSGLRIMQLGLELINLTIHFYLIKVLIGHTLYMVMSKKSFLMTCQKHLARQ